LERLAVAKLKPSEAKAIIATGGSAMQQQLERLSDTEQAELADLQTRLTDRGVGLIFQGDKDYPDRLIESSSPPPFLFFWGNIELLKERGIGMCGSRHVSERGLDAARLCGELVARSSWHVVSGYAKGVDTETHHAALRAGAGTVIVLAEGILNFRRKRALSDVPFDDERVLALSQFPPTQPWTIGGAMTRNGLIGALGEALVVVEAGEKGGTLDAGSRALRAGQRVFALQFSDDTPPGNQLLISQGAQVVKTPHELAEVISQLRARPPARAQMPLPGSLQSSKAS
jgi:DNA processing protein